MNKKLLCNLICFSLSLAVSFVPGRGDGARTFALAPASNAYDVMDAVNAFRASHGLPRYRINSILMQLAQAQADYLASTGAIHGDLGPGGSFASQRARAAGYPLAGGFISQNWAQAASAQDAVDLWTRDALHLGTMLSPNLFEIGAGVTSSGDSTYYVIVAAQPTGSTSPYTPAAGGETQVIVSGTPASQEATIPVVIVSSPDKNGNVYYNVQSGQTLSQIAAAYKTQVDQIKLLNNLSGDVIFPGQKLFIRRSGTITPTPAPPTPTRELSTFTPLPTLQILSPTSTQTETPIPVAPIPGPGQAGGAVGAIILVALVAAGLVAWAGRSRPI
jgi:LysM repeat protein